MNPNGAAPNVAAEIDTEAQAAATAAAAPASEPPTGGTLSNGIVVKFRAVAPLFIEAAQGQVPVPVVPKYWNTDREREEPNPADGDYLKACERYENVVNLAALNAMLIQGVSIVSVPDDMDGLDDNGWIELCEAVGIGVKADSVPARKLAYLRNYALQTAGDLDLALRGVARLTGISEEDVASSLDAFRRGEGRGADPPGAGDEGARNGDHVPAASAGDGVGV